MDQTKLPVTSLTLLVLITLMGCTRATISTGDQGVPSPDGDTRVILTAHGAPGKPYPERTQKQLDISIVRGTLPYRKILYAHRYKFVGADLCGHAEWDTANKVAVDVYDYPEGILAGDAQKSGTPSNHIATLLFEYDWGRKEFFEKN